MRTDEDAREPAPIWPGRFSGFCFNSHPARVDKETKDVHNRTSWRGQRPESGDPTVVSRLTISRRLRGLPIEQHPELPRVEPSVRAPIWEAQWKFSVQGEHKALNPFTRD